MVVAHEHEDLCVPRLWFVLQTMPAHKGPADTICEEILVEARAPELKKNFPGQAPNEQRLKEFMERMYPSPTSDGIDTSLKVIVQNVKELLADREEKRQNRAKNSITNAEKQARASGIKPSWLCLGGRAWQ